MYAINSQYVKLKKMGDEAVIKVIKGNFLPYQVAGVTVTK